MRKILFSLAIITLTLSGAAELDAVSAPPPKNRIVVELILEKDTVASHKFKVPIVADAKSGKRVDDQFEAGCFGFTGSCDKEIGCYYCVFFQADAVGEDRVKVAAGLSFKTKPKCDVSKEFLVVRGQPTEIKTKCVKLKAYYE